MTKLSAVILMVALAANATGGAFAGGKVRVAQTVIPEGTGFCFSPEVKGFNLLNDDYAVIMNGNRVEVRACRESRIPFNRVWPGRQRPLDQTERASYIACEADGPIACRVTPKHAVKRAVVRPLSKGVSASLTDGTASFTLPGPGYYVLETDGPHKALHIFVEKPRTFAEAADATLHYGPGVHVAGLVRLKSHDRVYIDRDAIVFGCFTGENVEDVKISGHGVIDGRVCERVFDGCYSPLQFSCLRFHGSRGISVDGPVLMDSPNWVLAVFGCEDVDIRHIKIIGQWRYNTDGVDICNSRRVAVRDSFVRSFDDTIAIKGVPPLRDLPVEDVTVERCVLWCGWGKTIEPGIETWAPCFRNIRFSDCDLMRNAHAAINISAGGTAVQEDFLFENIRVELNADDAPMILQESDGMRYDPAGKKGSPMLVKVDNSHYGCSKNETFGHVRNCTFRDIAVFSEDGVPPPQIMVVSQTPAGGRMRPFENIVFERFSINGKAADWSQFSFFTNTPVRLAAGVRNGGLPDRIHAFKNPAKMEMLRPGEVKPQGWLRDWCVTARNGYISRMDEIDQAFPRAWNRDFHPRGKYLDWDDPDKGAWCAEGGAYWFEGLVRLAWELDDAELKAYATKRLEPLFECMNPSAIAFVHWMDRNDPAQLEEIEKANHGFILGACARTTRAVIAYYEATGDARALRALKWCLDDPRFYFFGNLIAFPGAACDAWRYCGDKKIADAIDNFFATKPYPDRWPAMRYGLPVRPDQIAMTADALKDWRPQHGVLFYESALSWIKGTCWTGDGKYLANILSWFDWTEKNCRQPYGVVVADEVYGYPGPFRATETCTVAGDIAAYATLASVTGEGRFADHVERSFFNAAPACVSRDFMHHVYFQTPNRIVGEGSFRDPIGPGRSGGVYKAKHWPLCCTAALTRIIPGYVQWMWMKPACGGLAAALYAPNTLETTLDGVSVRIETKTDYPFGETLAMVVSPAKPHAFPLRLRVPEWCANPCFSVNGVKVAPAVGADGFAVFAREWKAGDAVTLTFPMLPKCETMRDFNNGGKPYCSLTCGPLLFACGLPEQDENTPVPGARTDWRLDSLRILADVAVIREPMPEKWDWPLDAPVKLKTKAVDGSPLELVPYGCAKLRISMFPDVAANAVDRNDAARMGAEMMNPGNGLGCLERKCGGGFKVLIYGNSIALHAPKADIGWTNRCGMAASAPEKDFAHLVVAGLESKLGKKADFRIRNLATLERNFTTNIAAVAEIAADADWRPDYVVVAIGENVPNIDTSNAAAYRKCLADIARPFADGGAKIVMRSPFWRNAAKADCTAKAAAEVGAVYVDAGHLGGKDENKALGLFSHGGVANHPGDLGMKRLADLILAAYK